MIDVFWYPIFKLWMGVIVRELGACRPLCLGLGAVFTQNLRTSSGVKPFLVACTLGISHPDMDLSWLPYFGCHRNQSIVLLAIIVDIFVA